MIREKKRILIEGGNYELGHQPAFSTFNIYFLNFRATKTLDVTYISPRESSFRMTLHKKVIKKMDHKDDDIITFVEKKGK
ncbi:MAG: hypothetical protein QXU18_06850 [Thermoplasmatales archaeon]